MRSGVKQLQPERFGETPSGTALTTEQRRIKELEDRIKRLEREKSILKKATALLMSDGAQHLR
jgi:transposase